MTPSQGEQEIGLADQILAGNPQKVVWSLSGTVGPELSLRYDEALRWPVTEWRQCGGRVRLEEASVVAAWIRCLSLEWGPGA